MKIVGNELADQLADNEAKDPHQPYGMAASPTRSGIRTVGRRLLEHTRDTWWKDKSTTTHFKKWPLRPIVPPRTRQEGLAYLAQLIDQPQEFETFVKVTNSFYDE
ncbi:hypothetical protein Ptr902_13176 [Pyrenophora tritici-repentis]|nr:hypothetical protein Ptr902_13176 [Pyrenophora tritici-repentis]